MTHHARILSIEERRGAVLLGVVQGYPLRQVCLCRGDRAHEKPCRPQGTVRRHKHGSILDLLRQGQELFTQFMRCLQLGVVSL